MHDTGSVFYGDNTTTYARVNSSGLTIVDDDATVATFGSDIDLIGGTITINDGDEDRLVISANDVKMYDEAGNEYAAIGMESVGELLEIYEDTIELVKSLTVNPEFKDFDWDTPIKDQPWYTPSTEIDLDRDVPTYEDWVLGHVGEPEYLGDR